MKKYVFENGKAIVTNGMNRNELKVEVMKNGKLISVEKI